MRKSSWIAALALSAGLGTACLADITGKVTLTGKIPDMPEIKAIKDNPDCAKMHKDPVYEETVVAGDKGELANVVVSIKVPEGKKLEGGKPQPAVLDQKGCMYVPHVVAVQIGQPVVTKTSDSVLHNVHTLAIDNPAVNKGMPGGSAAINLGPYTVVEPIKVKCDVHPWMVAWIYVLDSPFYAVTGEDGMYKIDTTGLPDGDYELVFWHEKYKDKTQKITVKGGKATANATYDTGVKAQAPMGGVIETKVASLMTNSTTTTCADGSCCDAPTKAAAILTAAKSK